LRKDLVRRCPRDGADLRWIRVSPSRKRAANYRDRREVDLVIKSKAAASVNASALRPEIPRDRVGERFIAGARCSPPGPDAVPYGDRLPAVPVSASRQSKLYPHIDVYGAPAPDPGLGLNYLGYASPRLLREYRLGLITCIKDELRHDGFSAQHL
jgi:hypothetical protein